MKISDIKEVETIGTVCDNDLNVERYKIDSDLYKDAFLTTGDGEMDPIPYEEGMPNIEVIYLDKPENI